MNKKIKLKKFRVITAQAKIQKIAKMTGGIIGVETLKIDLYRKGDNVTEEPKWFTKFRIENDKRWEENNRRWEQNDKRWEENNKRWEQNDKRWEEQVKFNKQVSDFNKQVSDFMKTITSLPTVKKELGL